MPTRTGAGQGSSQWDPQGPGVERGWGAGKQVSEWGVTLGRAGPGEAGGQEGGSVGWWGEDTYTSQGWPRCGGPGREKGSGVWVGEETKGG